MRTRPRKSAASAMTFASVLENPLYLRRDVLYSLSPPTGFLHRIGQKNELIMELAPILMGSAVSCVFVYGNPGAGKTGILLSLLDELKQEAGSRSMKLKTAYVNCSENRTETVILLEILNQLNPAKNYPKMGWNRAMVIDEFSSALDDKDTQLLVLLDEVDYVLKESGDDILYRLSRINDTVKTKVSTIVISNDVRVADYLKPRTRSAVSRVKVIFPPYTDEELYDILKARSSHAFKSGVVADHVLRKIAEIEAHRDGDARKALELLDNCAKNAVAKKRAKITLDLVNDADATLERDQTLNIITSLTQQQKLVYLSILKNQASIMGGMDVYKLYQETCSSYNLKPLTERRVRSFCVNLKDLGLVESEVGWLSDLKKKTRRIEVTLDDALKEKVVKVLRDSL
ncbi:AAA family ATPase [Candidatus Woesearchaeota archaeon]|nr:AAA family ATPase [Candidatus Woesearchaeota archaeon]